MFLQYYFVGIKYFSILQWQFSLKYLVYTQFGWNLLKCPLEIQRHRHLHFIDGYGPATRRLRIGKKMFFNNTQWGFKILIKAPLSFFKYFFLPLLALPIGTKPDNTALKWNADKKTKNKSGKVLFSCCWNCVPAPAWVHEVTVAKIFSLKSLYLDSQHDIFEIEAQRDHFH